MARLNSGSSKAERDEPDHHEPTAAPSIAQPPVDRMHRSSSDGGDTEERADAAGPRPSRVRNTSGMTGSSIAMVAATGDDDERADRDGTMHQHLAHRRRGADAVRARRDEGEHNQIGDSQGRDEQKRQADAADLVEPAAEHRSDDDAEAAARHREPHRAAALRRAVEIGDEREADDPRHTVGRALQQPRDEEHRQRRRVGKGQRRRREQREPEHHRPFPPEAIRERAHRNRQDEQREAERRKQQPDHRRARVEPRRVIGKDRNRDGVGDEICERGGRDTREDHAPGVGDEG